MEPIPITCERVRQMLLDAAKADEMRSPLVELAEHIVGCATCRGALSTMAAIIGIPGTTNSIVCAACESDIAGYIECELDQGTRAAALAYPDVWRHLWLCPACTELYHLTRTLEAASRSGALPPMPSPSASPATPAIFSHRVQLKRSFLNYTLPKPAAALGPVRGRDHGSTVLMADENENNPLTLSVQRQDEHSWRISVAIAIPISGWLVLTLGDHTYRARFDMQGKASVSDIPDTLLSATEGPDLMVGIEPDQRAALGI